MAVDDLWHRKTGEGECAIHRVKQPPSNQHERGKRWRVRYKDHNDDLKQRLFDSQKEARDFDRRVQGEVQRGDYRDPEKLNTAIEKYAERWRSAQDHEGTTIERLERDLRLHVYPILGKKRIGHVESIDIQEWMKNRRAVLNTTTLQVIYSHLKSMFTRAEIDGYVRPDRNPFRAVKKPTDDNDGVHFIPTTEQVRAIAAALPPRYRALVLVAAGSGLRQGELWGLELDKIDLENGEITVSQQLQMVGTGDQRRRFLTKPKSKTSKRKVEIASHAVDALRRHIEEFPPVGIYIDDNTDENKPRHRKANLIFLTGEGQPLNRAQWAHMWSAARRRAGAPDEFTFHDLRHYFATALIEGGASVKTVQDALGHATAMITLNTYYGYWPNRISSIRDVLDRHWS